MKITDIRVARSDKQGEPMISKYTKREQAKVSIKVDEPEAPYAGKWISSFVELGDPAEAWKIGQDVNINITQNGDFWNFKQARQGGGRNGAAELNNPNGQIIEKLFTKLNLIQAEVEKIGKMLGQKEVKVEDEMPPLVDNPF